MLTKIFSPGSRPLVAASTPARLFHSSFLVRKDEPSSGSIFGGLTQKSGKNKLDSIVESSDGAEDESGEAPKIDYTKVDFSQDADVLAINYPTPKIAPQILLSDLKQRLYDKAMTTEGGYSKNKVIELDGKRYILSLTKKEMELLEPSVYLRSYRIKSTPKKGTVFTRLLRNMDLDKAITQCHFSAKKISRDVEDMLLRGRKEAEALGLNPSDLYINQIWVGKEPYIQKRVEFKGRGRTGIIEHKYVHVRVILKTKESRQKFLEAKKEKILNRKVYEQHHSLPIHVHRGSSQYQW